MTAYTAEYSPTENIIRYHLPSGTVTYNATLSTGNSQLYDIAPPISPKTNNMPMLILLSIVLLGTFFIIQIKRNKARTPTKTPDPLLVIEQLPNTLNKTLYKEHYALIDNCIKDLLSEKIGVNCLPLTAAEIKAVQPPGIANSDKINQLLTQSETQRFSDKSPTQDQYQAHLTAAKNCIKELKGQRNK